MAVIFPEGEEWVAVDTFSKDEDITWVKETAEWRDFEFFLSNYFDEEARRRRSKWFKSSEEDSRAIPGGRYGCAQFLKICGPPSLQRCSLGRLNYMVQIAIREDLLRYQRTLLVWTSQESKPRMPGFQKKLAVIQDAVRDLLATSRVGISLAQIPMQLKREKNLSFDVNGLGFAKLKDLLATIPGVKIELRGVNHPFATLDRSGSEDIETM
jgi:hypothetical protein